MRILMVDDEADVLQALMAIMRTIPGHEVRVAANSQKAHEHAAAMGGVDLLISDVVMAPTDGFTLRAELQAIYPQMETVFLTGFDLSDHAERIGGTPVLAKPVDIGEIRQMIASFVLSQPEPDSDEAPVAMAAPVAVQAQAPGVPVAVPQTSRPQPTVAVPATARAVPHAVAAPRAVAVQSGIPNQPVSAVPAPQATVRAVPPPPMHASLQPQAGPGSQPAAAPRPAAVPVPRSGVRAVPPPGAVPRAAVQPPPVPVAAPLSGVRAVPQPAAAPRPAVAQPSAAPQPTVRAVAPQASGVRQAVPAAKATALTGPTVVQAAAPPTVRAVAPPAPVAQAAVPVAAVAAAEAAADPLIGVQLGDYRVQQLIGRDRWGRHYTALQLSVNRRVGLRVLDPELAQDEQNRASFLDDARAKAAVQHPRIISVFEADEQNGLVFYTHESLDGASMQERIAQGRFLDEKTALQVMQVAAEGLHYMWTRNLAHGPLDASGIRVGADNIARLANLATAHPDPSASVESEIQTLAEITRQVAPEQTLSLGLRTLLGRMSGGANPVTSWPVVLQAVKALEPKVIPMEAAKMRAADAAAAKAIEAAAVARKRALYISIGTLSLLGLLLAVVIWKFGPPTARKLDAQVLIPAGDYLVRSSDGGGSSDGDGKVNLTAFEIDQYEITISEYAKFIAWCKQNPEKEHEFDHPQGERRTSHLHATVVILIDNAKVRGARVFKQPPDPGVEVDMNSPMVGVTFWDAYAYAKWRGAVLEGGTVRDLPTEEEWEAAARGSKGFKYPWGDELKLKNFNSNEGYQPLKPGAPGGVDGYNYWAPVDAMTADQSPFKVYGMAGNVCEWVYRKEGGREIPLLKGGSFASDPIPMSGRVQKIPADDAWHVWPAASKPKGSVTPGAGNDRLFVGDPVTPSTRALYIGFRTVKRK